MKKKKNIYIYMDLLEYKSGNEDIAWGRSELEVLIY